MVFSFLIFYWDAYLIPLMNEAAFPAISGESTITEASLLRQRALSLKLWLPINTNLLSITTSLVWVVTSGLSKNTLTPPLESMAAVCLLSSLRGEPFLSLFSFSRSTEAFTPLDAADIKSALSLG